jgi:hypothetical protein
VMAVMHTHIMVLRIMVRILRVSDAMWCSRYNLLGVAVCKLRFHYSSLMIAMLELLSQS